MTRRTANITQCIKRIIILINYDNVCSKLISMNIIIPMNDQWKKYILKAAIKYHLFKKNTRYFINKRKSKCWWDNIKIFYLKNPQILKKFDGKNLLLMHIWSNLKVLQCLGIILDEECRWIIHAVGWDEMAHPIDSDGRPYEWRVF